QRTCGRRAAMRGDTAALPCCDSQRGTGTAPAFHVAVDEHALQEVPDPRPANLLGQSQQFGHHKLKPVPAVSRTTGRTLPDDPRAVPGPAHESLQALLEPGRTVRARL